ncbi:hypothetical protein [Paenibacillus sp. PL91]|uniref:hypothetical protein n=1 Tax=Paenibacillus sp. PL91 TaxID=2729538 RepID=UPI00145D495A|nr:hypothetical protein [Paenibacillus sp. PL91]MBC9202466.1 hypothetical protein [Paenibacillus sp. PL91]
MARVRTALLLAICLTAAAGCTSKSEQPLPASGSNPASTMDPNAGERIDADQVTVGSYS